MFAVAGCAVIANTRSVVASAVTETIAPVDRPWPTDVVELLMIVDDPWLTKFFWTEALALLASAADRIDVPASVMPSVLTVALFVIENNESISMPPPTPIDQAGIVTDASVTTVFATATVGVPRPKT